MRSGQHAWQGQSLQAFLRSSGREAQQTTVPHDVVRTLYTQESMRLSVVYQLNPPLPKSSVGWDSMRISDPVHGCLTLLPCNAGPTARSSCFRSGNEWKRLQSHLTTSTLLFQRKSNRRGSRSCRQQQTPLRRDDDGMLESTQKARKSPPPRLERGQICRTSSFIFDDSLPARNSK